MEEFKDILPVKGFFMEDALEDLFQSKTLLEKSVEQMVNSKISKAPRADDIQPRVLRKLKDIIVEVMISVC